jgi:GPH family glycoside/pentoside/hexuronide:cation symporter
VIFILSAMSVKNVDVYDPAAKNAKTEKKGFSLKETFSVITKNKALLCVLIAYGTDMLENPCF